VYARVIGDEINDRGWPWTTFTHFIALYVRIRSPPREFEWR